MTYLLALFIRVGYRQPWPTKCRKCYFFPFFKFWWYCLRVYGRGVCVCGGGCMRVWGVWSGVCGYGVCGVGFDALGCCFCVLCLFPLSLFYLTAHYWQNWKRVFLSCYFHKIYMVEAVSLKIPIILKRLQYLWLCEFVCNFLKNRYFGNNCLI